MPRIQIIPASEKGILVKTERCEHFLKLEVWNVEAYVFW